MQIYKTIAVDTDIPVTRPNRVSWQASQTEASKARTAAKADKMKAETRTVNIPTAKGPLIEWLNDNVTA